ncbi:MAG TPA: cytochrome c, partial [Cyclobacteriaceae bacterium]|nr:cytochrome c [Cyclobacteriaceae bacterium]
MIKHFTSSLSKFLSVVILFSLLSFVSRAQDIPEDATSITAGETLFNSNCKSCHKIHTESVGPPLAGIENRAPSVEWIVRWVHNSSKVVASGDEYGVAIFEKYKKSKMTDFTTLKDDQILSILAYVKAEANKPVETPAA